ncbi:MAG: RNA-binding cell elongation regulator Jag/EloR [Ilumatobacteraceae bacterium]
METTARSLEEARGLALDELGVGEEDAEFEILEEPKAGLFGRVRGEARVRARVRPTQARQKVDRRDRRRKKSDSADGADSADGGNTDAEPVSAVAAAAESTPQVPRPARTRQPKPPASSSSTEPRESSKETSTVTPAQVGEQARQFVDQLIVAFGLQGTTELAEDGDDLEIQVHGHDLGLLVGPRGATLQAVQDLTRVASQRRLGDHETRLRVDVGGYRVRRREALSRFATQVADEVKSAGTSRALEPMSSADRKVIHDTLSEIDGVSTRSEGEDPNRRVIVDPIPG